MPSRLMSRPRPRPRLHARAGRKPQARKGEPGGGAAAPVPILARYRVKKGKASAFAAILRKHWPTLHRAGLTTAAKAKVLRCEDKAGNVAFIETFAWKRPDSSRAAHQSPEVMSLWEPMGALCEDMEFWVTSAETMPYATGR